MGNLSFQTKCISYGIFGADTPESSTGQWAIQENIGPEEIAQYGLFKYWANSTGQYVKIYPPKSSHHKIPATFVFF